MLKQDSELPFTTKEFLELCSSQLSPKDFSSVEQVKITGNGEPLHPVIIQWNTFKSSLTDDMASVRAERIGRDQDRYAVQFREVPATLDMVKRAAGASDPLEASRLLLAAEWNYAEELGVGHTFDVVKIMIYFLKLQLLERKSYWSRELGMDVYNHVFSNIQVTG